MYFNKSKLRVYPLPNLELHADYNTVVLFMNNGGRRKLVVRGIVQVLPGWR